MALDMEVGSSGDATVQKPNLRTCGRWSPENRAPTRVLSKEHKEAKSVPTIPSRFEVTLHKGDRECLGFGSKALKWNKGVGGEAVPGPGNYGKPKAFHEVSESLKECGIRGTGGFASRSTRFGARSLPTLPPGHGCPGPGAYKPDLKPIRDPKDFNKAKVSSCFAPNNNHSSIGSDEAMPGPGHYASMVRADAKEASAAQAAFKSASRRDDGPLDSANMPGPGQYHEEIRWSDEQEIVTANFRDLSKPRITRVHRDLPAADSRQRKVLGDYGDEVGKICLGTNGLATRLPGPGHYDQDRDSMWDGGLVGTLGLSSFVPGTQRTDFAGSEENRLMPGPGRYNPNKLYPETKTSALSAFQSESERNKLALPAAPGPCYYNPPAPKSNKTSFQCNARRLWAVS